MVVYLQLFKDELQLEPHVVCVLIATHNELSIVWSNRETEIDK